MKLALDAVSIKGTGSIVEHITSENPNPVDRVEIGTEFEVRGVLGAASQSELVTVMGGSVASNVYSKIQGIRTLPKFDMRIAVHRASDGKLVLKDITDLNFMPELEESFEQKKRFYLPFIAKSTDTSDYTSDNSAV